MERFYRRDLPHWRLEGPSVVYFVTWRLASGQAELRPDERGIVADTITYWDGTRCDLLAWVVMNDHAHAVVRPRPGVRLEALTHSWKSFSAHRLVRDGRRPAPLWQHESFDRIIRDEAEQIRTMRYVCWNPVKRWPELTEYLWVWPKLEHTV